MDTLIKLVALAVTLHVAASKKCPDIMVWDECGSQCDATCDNPYPICMAVCVPRCECPAYAPILHNGDCIPLSKCSGEKCPSLMCEKPCEDGYATGDDGCQTCNCIKGPLVGAVRPQGDEEVPCPEIQCPNYCPGGYKDDVDGCMLCDCREYVLPEADLCEGVACTEEGQVCGVFTFTSSGHRVARCIDPSWPAPCQFPMDAGPCRGFKSRWFYDQRSLECLEFEYGGCKGNWNNFDSKGECENQCMADPAVTCEALQCEKECEHNFAMDERGCYVCECGDREGKVLVEEPESTCPQPAPMCMMECEWGFKKDVRGCPLCECVDESACAEVSCLMECAYGFLKDDYNCKICACAEDPCEFKRCDEGHICQAKEFNPREWTAECVDPEAARVWCKVGPMCMIECEYGFAENSYGCPLCSCRDGPPTCTLQECEPCEYGHKYDKTGCRKCECLPDPCTLKKCGENMACEEIATPKCKSCPHTARCIDGLSAQRVTVDLDFSHAMFDDEDFNEDEFIREFERRASKIMGIHDEYIRDVKLRFKGIGEVTVRFHVVTFGEIDLVQAFNHFCDKVAQHEPGAAVPIAGVDFIPVHESLHAQYSSQATYTEPNDYDDDGGMDELDGDDVTMTVIVVACACGAAVFLIVLVILVCTLKRARVAQKHRPTSTAIYKKAPTSDPSPSKQKAAQAAQAKENATKVKESEQAAV